MIGKLNTSKKEAIIIGAGISGLIIGYRLKKLGYQIEIHEATDRAGGLIQTIQTPYGIAEAAAHSLMVNSVVKGFLDELDVPMIEVKKNSRARFILRGKKLRKFPLNGLEAISTANRFFSAPKQTLDWNTANLKDWCLNYLGKPAHDFLLSPFVSGVFACSPEELNARLSFPKLIPQKEQSLFQHFRSIKQKSAGPARMMAPKFGMQNLVEKLVNSLQSDIRYHSKIETLPQDCANVICCLPAPQLANLIFPLYPEAAESLNSICYSPLVTSTVSFKNNSFQKQPPNGVGVLIPRSENIRALGVLYNSSAFENRSLQPNIASLTFMFGGTSDPSAVHLSDQQIADEIAKAGKVLFQTSTPPIHIQTTRWKSAIPIYSNTLFKAHDLLNKTLCNKPGKIVFTNYSGQVSIRGMIESTQYL